MSTKEWRHWQHKFVDSVAADLPRHLSGDPITALRLTRIVKPNAEPWHYWAVCGWLDHQVARRRVWVMRHRGRLVYCTSERGEELALAGRVTEPREHMSLYQTITPEGLVELGLRRDNSRR